MRFPLASLLALALAGSVSAKFPIQARVESAASSAVSSDGDGLAFKILQLADLHLTGIPGLQCNDPPRDMAPGVCNESLTTVFIAELLDVEKPDFVVFSGDNVNIYSRRARQRAVDAVTDEVEARGIPYAMVFGNHDESGDFPREEIMQFFNQKPHSYAERGPTSVDGVGNYLLNVSAPADGVWGAKGDDVLRMYFLDSGAEADTTQYPYVFSEYDWIKPSQIKYYRELSAAGQARSGGHVLPALMFFHIPLIEYSFVTSSRCHGEKHEGVSSQGMNLRLLSTLASVGEVKAVFVGHDHLNEYCCLVDGVQLCYGGGTGFGRAYGSPDFIRRARVIEWTIDGQGHRKIRSWKRFYGDINAVHSEEVLYSEGS